MERICLIMSFWKKKRKKIDNAGRKGNTASTHYESRRKTRWRDVTWVHQAYPINQKTEEESVESVTSLRKESLSGKKFPGNYYSCIISHPQPHSEKKSIRGINWHMIDPFLESCFFFRLAERDDFGTQLTQYNSFNLI